jgi:hypothetical protein
MKLHSIIAPLSENDNDDMFPGVASSVFDDAKAPELDMNDQLVKFKNLKKFYQLRRSTILRDMDNNGAREYVGPGFSPPGPNIISYSSFDWFGEESLSAGLSKHHGIEKSSPYLKDIENTIRKLDRLYNRESFFFLKKIEMEKMIRGAVKHEEQQRKGKR